MAQPSGPAGGDLGGTYPNPTVVSLANATTGPATYPAGSAALLTNLVALELMGVIPDATVPDPLPAVSGANLIDLPPVAIGEPGTVATGNANLDGSAFYTVAPPAPIAPASDFAVYGIVRSNGFLGYLVAEQTAKTLSSSVGGADGGLAITWFAVYF